MPPDDCPLESPSGASPSAPIWTIYAHSGNALRGWRDLVESVPDKLDKCFKWLSQSATTAIPRKCFPLKGKKFDGCWEYEVNRGDRVFYKVEPEKKIVRVYYAGPHPKNTPNPP